MGHKHWKDWNEDEERDVEELEREDQAWDDERKSQGHDEGHHRRKGRPRERGPRHPERRRRLDDDDL